MKARRPVTDSELCEWAAKHAQGATLRELAAASGRDHKTIYFALKRIGISGEDRLRGPRPGWCDECSDWKYLNLRTGWCDACTRWLNQKRRFHSRFPVDTPSEYEA